MRSATRFRRKRTVPQALIDLIRTGIDAGFDHIYLHQVGDDQEGFFRFAEKEILPKFR